MPALHHESVHPAWAILGAGKQLPWTDHLQNLLVMRWGHLRMGQFIQNLPGLNIHRRAAGHSCTLPRAESHSSRRPIPQRTFQRRCSRAASSEGAPATWSAFYNSPRRRCPATNQSLRSWQPCSDQPVRKRMSIKNSFIECFLPGSSLQRGLGARSGDWRGTPCRPQPGKERRWFENNKNRLNRTIFEFCLSRVVCLLIGFLPILNITLSEHLPG